MEDNLVHATPFVEKAAAEGASLVVLPELSSPGYVPNPAIWDAAEPRGGPTEKWLATTAGRLGVHLGAGWVETDGTDFFNAYTLAGPDGLLAGRAYKANGEANVFRRGRHEHVIDTSLGRIGVGICADNQFAAQLRSFHEQDAGLILMPHAWPTPVRAAGLVQESDVAAHERRTADLPVLYARSLGVPVVFVNQIGPLLRVGGILGKVLDPDVWRLRGRSLIADSDASVAGSLGEDEGVLVATVSCDPARRHCAEPESFGGWLQRGSLVTRKVVIPLDILIGRLSYTARGQRRHKARAAARARAS